MTQTPPDETEPKAPPIDGPGLDAPAADGPLSDAMVEPPTVTVPARRQSVVRSSAIYSGLTLVSRFMGFARDLAITATMGASASIAADAYNTAQMFPNVFRRIFAEGAFSSAFVPAYAKSLAKDGEETADILAADAMAVLTTATLVILFAAELGMTYIMYVISPGYLHDPHDPQHIKFGLAVWLTRVTMPYLPCMAIYAHLAGVLQARGRFIFSALAPTLLNLVMLIAVLPQKTAIGAAHAASWGVLVAGVLQAGLLWWGVSRSGGRVDFRWPRLTPEIKSLIALAVPGAIAASATQINIMISNVLASQVNGARSWLAVADRLYQLPLGLVGVAIGVALLPRLSTAVQSGDRVESQGAMDEAIILALAFTLPAAAALMAMPYFPHRRPVHPRRIPCGGCAADGGGPVPLWLGRAGVRAAAHSGSGLLRAAGHQVADAFCFDLRRVEHRFRDRPLPCGRLPGHRRRHRDRLLGQCGDDGDHLGAARALQSRRRKP